MYRKLRELECANPALRRLRAKCRLRKARRVLVASIFLLAGWYASNQRVFGEDLREEAAYHMGDGPSYGMLLIKYRIIPYRIG